MAAPSSSSADAGSSEANQSSSACGLPTLELFGGARKGAKQWQEDAFFHYTSPSGLTAVAGVLDGHGGYNGLIASNTARDVAVQFLKNNAAALETWSTEEWADKLRELFTIMHDSIRERFVNDSTAAPRKKFGGGKAGGARYVDDKKIVRNANGDPVHGGSTGTISAVRRDPSDGSIVIITANVGDSTGVVIKDASGSDFKFVTVDHGPENKKEYARVQELSSQLYPTKLLFVYDKANVYRKYECPLVFLPSGQKDPELVRNPWGNGLHPTNVRYEPAVYAVTPRSVSKDTTCIAMTRALGDFYAHQFGLTHEPDVTVRKVPAGTQFTLALASDGIWDCWKYEDFSQYLANKMASESIDNAVELTLSETIQRAVSNFGAKHYDDASLVCIRALPPSE